MLNSRLLVLAGAAILASSADARPDRNAFLNKAATTTERLVLQVKTDSAVADRYARHYAMPKQDVVVYLSSLRPGTTAKDAVYTVYSVPEGGFLKVHTEIVRKGTPVFKDIRGVPTLIMKCGNPLTRGPRQPEMPNEATTDVVEDERISLKELTDDSIAATPDLDPLEVFSEPELNQIPDDVVPPTTTPPTTGGSPNTIANPGGGGFNFAPFAIGLTMLGGALSSGSGSNAVPEPGTILALTMGASYLILRRRRK